MIYKKTEGNITHTYEVKITDRDRVEEMLSDIVVKTSYTTPRQEQKLPCDPQLDLIINELAKKLPDNQTFVYDEIDSLDSYITSPPSIDDDKIRPYGQPVIKAKKTVAPKLAYIVRDLLDGKDDAPENFIAYENDGEIVDIDERMSSAENAKDIIDAISNEDVKAQKSIYDRAFDLERKKKAGEVFDTELLRKLYYGIAACFSVQLIKIEAGIIRADVTGPITTLQYFLQGSSDSIIKK